MSETITIPKKTIILGLVITILILVVALITSADTRTNIPKPLPIGTEVSKQTTLIKITIGLFFLYSFKTLIAAPQKHITSKQKQEHI